MKKNKYLNTLSKYIENQLHLVFFPAFSIVNCVQQSYISNAHSTFKLIGKSPRSDTAQVAYILIVVMVVAAAHRVDAARIILSTYHDESVAARARAIDQIGINHLGFRVSARCAMPKGNYSTIFCD